MTAIEKALREAQNNGLLNLPTGYALKAVGSFQNQIEANQRLLWVIPVVILINLFIIYLQFRKVAVSLIVFAGIPVAFAGGMLLLAFQTIETTRPSGSGSLPYSVSQSMTASSWQLTSVKSSRSDNPVRSRRSEKQPLRQVENEFVLA